MITPSISQSVGDIWRRTLALPMLRWANDEMQPLIDLLPDRATVVELGSFAGQCSVQFMKSTKVEFLLCVDRWEGGYDPDDKASGADMEAAKVAFDIRMSPFNKTADLSSSDYLSHYAVFRGSTLAASQGCKDHSCDLVYIDANHQLDSVRQDIRVWQRKVRPGGLLAGHDYDSVGHPGVKLAVDESFAGKVVILPDTSWYVRI